MGNSFENKSQSNCRFAGYGALPLVTYLAPDQPRCRHPAMAVRLLGDSVPHILDTSSLGSVQETAGSITLDHFVSLLRSAVSWPGPSSEKETPLMARQWSKVRSTVKRSGTDERQSGLYADLVGSVRIGCDILQSHLFVCIIVYCMDARCLFARSQWRQFCTRCQKRLEQFPR